MLFDDWLDWAEGVGVGDDMANLRCREGTTCGKVSHRDDRRKDDRTEPL
jgi:hypothetical protein